MEVGIFVQDHWDVGDRVAFDAGVRLSGQTLGKADAVSPRLGLQYAPGKDNRTILRGGIGVFYSGPPAYGRELYQQSRAYDYIV